MNDYVKGFMEKEIGLDVFNSDYEDVKELSAIIQRDFPNAINTDEYYREIDKTLLSYWKELLEEDWTVCLYDSMRCFNAYKGELAESFKYKKQVMTAAEILGKPKVELENEVLNLFA